jgi:hypothetical protein
MPAPKWKYQIIPKKGNYDHIISFDNDKEKHMKIKRWEFKKNPVSGTLARADVVEEDGKKTDKIWNVWNFELAQELKKKFKSKDSKKELEIIIIRREKDMEESFEIKEIKQ